MLCTMRRVVAVAMLATLFVVGSGQISTTTADCDITGVCYALHNPDDSDLEWRYTLVASWEITDQWAMSHLDLILGLGECECICTDFSYAAPDTAGYAEGVKGDDQPCTAYFSPEFNCNGDPSIDFEGPLVKFEDMDDDCDPALIGTGEFWFYSDWPPRLVESENELLALKAGHGLFCFGTLSGQLPDCTCPTPAAPSTWGRVKTLYR